MKTNALYFLAFLLSFSVKAQTSHQVLSATGGDATGTGGSVAYSVGQIVYTTSTGTTGSLAQGVEQAYEIYSVGIKETTLNISLSVFPNPTSDLLNINATGIFGKSMFYVQDLNGRLVYQQESTFETLMKQTIDVSKLGIGLYHLIVINKDEKWVIPFSKN